MNAKIIISTNLLKAYHQVGKSISDLDLQANVEDFFDLTQDIPVDWLERCFKHARMHHANIPSPATIHRSWDSLKDDWRESKKRAALPDRSLEKREIHECNFCPIVAARCADYYGLSRDFIDLNAWQKEWLKAPPRQEEIECFNQKILDISIGEYLRKCYAPIYGK